MNAVVPEIAIPKLLSRPCPCPDFEHDVNALDPIIVQVVTVLSPKFVMNAVVPEIAMLTGDTKLLPVGTQPVNIPNPEILHIDTVLFCSLVTYTNGVNGSIGCGVVTEMARLHLVLFLMVAATKQSYVVPFCRPWTVPTTISLLMVALRLAEIP